MRGSMMGACLFLAAATAGAGSLVDVTVEVAGRPAALYPAPDGSGRLYFEAREGHPYSLRIANRTHERVGTLVIVDGLNAISGAREEVGPGRPGRLYVLGPWEDVTVRGWRSTLEEVRQFRFVDERASYSARVGKANRRMGWVEVGVYRERYPAAYGGWRRQAPMSPPDAARDRSAKEEDRAGAADAAEAPAAKAGRSDGGVAQSAPAPTGGYPGTGWGESTYDPAMVVAFEAANHPAERITLRYEYAPALRALGILPPPWPSRDRLGERDRGDGFAAPPRW